MSRYSGRYDFCDSLETHGYTLEQLQNNVNIYVGEDRTPLHIEKMSDLIIYYPHLIGCAFYNNDERKSEIHISSESYVDIEEREILGFYLKRILRIYNRCKRKKTEFDVEETIKVISWNDHNRDAIEELVNRVNTYGKKATIDNIHINSHEYYRKELVTTMIENGLNPKDFMGYARFY